MRLGGKLVTNHDTCFVACDCPSPESKEAIMWRCWKRMGFAVDLSRTANCPWRWTWLLECFAYSHENRVTWRNKTEPHSLENKSRRRQTRVWLRKSTLRHSRFLISSTFQLFARSKILTKDDQVTWGVKFKLDSTLPIPVTIFQSLGGVTWECGVAIEPRPSLSSTCYRLPSASRQLRRVTYVQHLDI